MDVASGANGISQEQPKKGSSAHKHIYSSSSSIGGPDMDLGTITIASLAERCPSLTISMTSAQPSKSQQQPGSMASSKSTMKIVNCMGTSVTLCPSVTIHAEKPLSRSVASIIPASIGFVPLTTSAGGSKTLQMPLNTRIIPVAQHSQQQQQQQQQRQGHKLGVNSGRIQTKPAIATNTVKIHSRQHTHGLRRAVPRIIVNSSAPFNNQLEKNPESVPTNALVRCPVNAPNRSSLSTKPVITTASVRTEGQSNPTIVTTPVQKTQPNMQTKTTRMREVLASIPDFSVKPKRRTNKKMSTAAQLEQTRSGCIDLETPDSILADTNLRALLNKHTFSVLPPLFQHKLIQLLPPVDRPTIPSDDLESGGSSSNSSSSIRLSSSSLNNEFFAKACLEWRERLAEGEFTPDNQVKLKAEEDRERCKVDPWKLKHFEPFWGSKECRDTNRRNRASCSGGTRPSLKTSRFISESNSTNRVGESVLNNHRPPLKTTIKLRPVHLVDGSRTIRGQTGTVASHVAEDSSSPAPNLSPRTLRTVGAVTRSSGMISSATVAEETSSKTTFAECSIVPPSPNKIGSVPDLLPIRTKVTKPETNALMPRPMQRFDNNQCATSETSSGGVSTSENSTNNSNVSGSLKRQSPSTIEEVLGSELDAFEVPVSSNKVMKCEEEQNDGADRIDEKMDDFDDKAKHQEEEIEMPSNLEVGQELLVNTTNILSLSGDPELGLSYMEAAGEAMLSPIHLEEYFSDIQDADEKVDVGPSTSSYQETKPETVLSEMGGLTTEGTNNNNINNINNSEHLSLKTLKEGTTPDKMEPLEDLEAVVNEIRPVDSAIEGRPTTIDGCMSSVEELEPTIQNIPMVVAAGHDVIDETFTDAENYVLESGEIEPASVVDHHLTEDEPLTDVMQNELLDVASELAEQGLSENHMASAEDQLEMGEYLPCPNPDRGQTVSPAGLLLDGLQPQQDWPSIGSSREDTASDNTMTGQVSESFPGASLSSTATTSPAMSACLDTDDASRDMASTMTYMNVVSPCTTSATSSSMGHLNLQDSSLGFDGEVSSTVVQDRSPTSNQQLNSGSEDSLPMTISGPNVEHHSSTSSNGGSIYTSAPVQMIESPASSAHQIQHSMGTGVQRPALNTQPSVNCPPSTGTIPPTQTSSTLDGQIAHAPIKPVMLNTTAPLVPTLGRPPSVKIMHLQSNLDPNAPGAVAMNTRAPGAAIQLRVPSGGTAVPPIATAAHRSGRGRGSTGNKPPPGAVNLERSYQICQAVIQNSPNRHQLRCQLRPPPPTPPPSNNSVSVGKTTNPAGDTQNALVTSSNRLVRLGGGVVKQVMAQRQSSPVMMRPVLITTNASTNGTSLKASENSLNVPRASSAPPPGQQFSVNSMNLNGGGIGVALKSGAESFRSRPNSVDQNVQMNCQQPQSMLVNPGSSGNVINSMTINTKVVSLKVAGHYANDDTPLQQQQQQQHFGKASNGTLVSTSLGAFPATGTGTDNSNSHNCSMNAMVICQKCGAFCHSDCMSSSKLCGSCVMIR